jgi:hypothetical protein
LLHDIVLTTEGTIVASTFCASSLLALLVVVLFAGFVSWSLFLSCNGPPTFQGHPLFTVTIIAQQQEGSIADGKEPAQRFCNSVPFPVSATNDRGNKPI